VQNTLQLSPAHGSLLFPAFNLAVIAGSLAGPRALDRLGSRRALVAGFVAVVAGALLLITLPPHGLPVLTLAGTFAAMGLGLGAASVASTAAGTDVPEADRGVAAGLLNSSAQLGTALGLAVTAPLVASAAPMLGYRLGFGTAALIGVAGVVSAGIVSAGTASHRGESVRSAGNP
jgi:MFS family permease